MAVLHDSTAQIVQNCSTLKVNRCNLLACVLCSPKLHGCVRGTRHKYVLQDSDAVDPVAVSFIASFNLGLLTVNTPPAKEGSQWKQMKPLMAWVGDVAKHTF